jgi:hypothetical protein
MPAMRRLSLRHLCQVRAAYIAPVLQQERIALRAGAGEVGQPLAQVAHAPVFLDQLIDVIAPLTRATATLDVERIKPAGNVVEGDVAATHEVEHKLQVDFEERISPTWLSK